MTLKVDEAWFNTQRSQDGTREFASCTAWVNFNGTGTVAIRDSLNVSSITDNGLGDYTVNFAQAMDNSDYAVGGTASRANSTDIGSAFISVQEATQTVNSVRLYVRLSTESVTDSFNTGLNFHGGIA